MFLFLSPFSWDYTGMTLTAPFRSLAAVAARLPFHLNETDKVNAAYLNWHQQDDKEAKYHVDLWTYYFVRRYFLIKFTRDELYNNAADMDDLIEQAYVKVQDPLTTVSDSAHYASWVSVVCKNAFLNYLRNLPQAVSIDQEDGPQLQGDSLEALYDTGMLHQGLREAVERLPEYVREIAYYRFIKGLSYQEIGQKIDKPLPVIRSYVNKAVRKLQKDTILLAYTDRSQL